MSIEEIIKIKLSIGMIIKNYKEMCFILEEKEKKGKSRLLQIANWERYFKWHKDGQKFIINEVFEMPIDKIDNRGKTENNKAKYLTNIESLILNLLVQGGSLGYGKVFLSKNKILRELKMINNNYAFCKLRLPKLSEFMNIDNEVIKEWYDSTSRMLESNLDSALKNLESQSLIFWSKEITIAKAIPLAEINKNKISKTKVIDQYDEEIINYDYYATNEVVLQYREGTDDEKRFILYTEKEILKEMGLDNKSQVIACGLWQDFIERVNNILLDKLNIAFYYKSYKILFNLEHVLENIDINDLVIKSWYTKLGILFQDYNAYGVLTVKENIEIDSVENGASNESVRDALKKASALKFVEKYKNGLDQILSERFKGGIRPSTGQWQKIAIARVFHRNSPVLILDEPTASIDAVAEAKIFDNIYKFAKDKTVIIISHRFSTVRNADRIIVLDKGKIIEQGSHEVLLKNNGKYAKAFKLQAKGYQ